MDALRIVIVDDEPLARAVLREYAAAEPDLEVVADCANGFEAVKAVADLKPDLVLLDVQMPRMDGFAVVDAIGEERMPEIIFVTAHDRYAIRAFEISAVDYLLVKHYHEAKRPLRYCHARDLVQQVLRQIGPAHGRGGGPVAGADVGRHPRVAVRGRS